MELEEMDENRDERTWKKHMLRVMTVFDREMPSQEKQEWKANLEERLGSLEPVQKRHVVQIRVPGTVLAH